MINNENPPDLLIIDPDFWPEGVLELLKKLKKCSPPLPVVVHTVALEFSEHPIIKSAADAFIEKRGNPAPLKDAVARVLRKNYPDHFPRASLSPVPGGDSHEPG